MTIATKETRVSDQDMAAYWDRAGRVWVEQQGLLDRMYQPIARAVVDAADPRAGEAVLDVGCGAGATTFEAAWRVGPEGRAVGVDISPQLIARAKADRKPDAPVAAAPASTEQ